MFGTKPAKVTGNQRAFDWLGDVDRYLEAATRDNKQSTDPVSFLADCGGGIPETRYGAALSVTALLERLRAAQVARSDQMLPRAIGYQ